MKAEGNERMKEATEMDAYNEDGGADTETRCFYYERIDELVWEPLPVHQCCTATTSLRVGITTQGRRRGFGILAS